jgi:amino acid transporter
MAITEKQRVEAASAGEPLPPLYSEDYVPRALPRYLRTRDMIALYVMAVFWISNVTGVSTGGTAAFTYWLICSVAFFVPCALVSAQLGVMFPNEGSLYNWTYKAFGKRGWGFFIGLCAWLPGVLSLVSAADVVVNCIQTLNPNWLGAAWQQGAVIIFITLFCGYVSLQRARTVQNIINVTAAVTVSVVLLIGLAAVMWLLQGHHSVTNFFDWSGWVVSWAPQTSNISLLGTVTLALLGTTMPLQMGGEIGGDSERGRRRIIINHLIWGTLIVTAGYFILTFAILAVQGQTAAFNAPNPIALLYGTVQASLGTVAGNIVMIGIMLFFVVVGIFESVVSSRLLLVAGIDSLLPSFFGRLNRNRVPANAIILQTIIAALYTFVVFFLVPLLLGLGNAASLTTRAYTVTAASLLLVWAFSFIFPFVDLAVLYFRNSRTVAARTAWRQQLIYPAPLLVGSVILGPLTCAGAMIVTLTGSWIPTLIDSSQWWYIVGGVTAVMLSLSAIGGMLASSQATWEGFFS